MSAPGGAPSPAPRSGSMGPGASGGMPMSSQQPMSGTPVHPTPTPGPPPPQSGAMSQQNLNQIVSGRSYMPYLATLPSALGTTGLVSMPLLLLFLKGSFCLLGCKVILG
ncbi:hypothetical protein N7462_002955 [Penicillium macrosclerotiorum]|uniref:uncharacterized protein n=1 Tax=Penicillium macrosclerotiorum TaxID=303699 RepID=UPI002546F4CB|nr:uncharacterized protein N7462_002955 [Penicillium macrosclerotiorum]KAJ5688563.1 hypothetical protein N7462_002955 [Penicillium macrosclerotiorum]